MILFNILFTGFIIYNAGNIFLSDLQDTQYLACNMYNLVNMYYLTDTIIEIIIFNRWLYVPHHLIAITSLHFIRNINYSSELLKEYSLYFLLIEYTAFLLNIRTLIKEKCNKIPICLEIFFFVNYSVLRITVLPIIIYRLDSNFLKANILLIFLMSIYWIYKWSNSIYIKILKC